MNSLAIKWVGSLLLTSLVGVALVGIFAYQTTVSEFDRLRMEQSRDAFLQDVTNYYRTNGTWSGLDAWLYEQDAASSGYERPVPPRLFALADVDGHIVLGHGPFIRGEQVSARMLDDGTPILIDGEPVGVVLVAEPQPALDPREQTYLNRTNQALLIGAVGAGVTALMIGMLLARLFSRPLTELTTAITAMAQGELNQQVQVHSRDELGKLAEAFNQMSAKVHRANHLRQQMTADIAHDLRTPLTVISGYLEALRDGTLKPTPERFEVMNQEALLLRRLIEDLRTLSLADAGELKLIRQKIQPLELLEQVKQSFEPIASEQQVILKVHVDDLLPDVHVDRERMVQVFENLVSNALRYTSVGGTVTLQARRCSADVCITVQDTGAGIAPDQLMNIFERFYRVDESRQQSAHETGLGLAIAKSIVEAHGGRITAESQRGIGTSMTIMLPAAADL